MKHFISKLLASYGWKDLHDLLLSLFPSWKYQLQQLSIIFSLITGIFSFLFGFGPLLALAVLVAIFTEVGTGIKASTKSGDDFESWRFSRCIIKLALWAILFFVIHQFENEYEGRTQFLDILAFLFFRIVFLSALTFFVFEHTTSILENIAVIDGRPKTALINVIQGFWKKFISLLTDRFK
jgi:hypothetical protein